MKRLAILKGIGAIGTAVMLMGTSAMANVGIVKLTIGSDVMVIDGKPVQMDAAPYIQASTGTTLVPLRYVVQALMGFNDDANLENNFLWDANNKVATVMYGSGTGTLEQKIMQFTVGSNKFVVNGYIKDIPNGAVPEIKNGRCYIPIKAVSDSLGCTALWDANTKSVTFRQG